MSDETFPPHTTTVTDATAPSRPSAEHSRAAVPHTESPLRSAVELEKKVPHKKAANGTEAAIKRTSTAKKGISYADAGVDITSADRSKQRIKMLARKTFNRHVLSEIGGFGGLFAL
ncbi:MAG TPA: hypothetical protein VLT57_15645, partial [Bryobacteraceae bacterium]|nr:hypothetical protein [Bryobacteraceae bacterium]